MFKFSGASGKLQAKVLAQADGVWSGRQAWDEQLTQWGIKNPTHRRLVSEAGLFGTLLTEDWYGELGLISDDAPQFKLLGFVHGLCWVHGERKIDRLIPLVTRHRRAKEQAQNTFWEIYKSLQTYRSEPSETAKLAIEAQFDELCQTKTGYPELNQSLDLLHAKREEFLAVLEYPHLPLHNNLSENDIREYARLRQGGSGVYSDFANVTSISSSRPLRRMVSRTTSPGCFVSMADNRSSAVTTGWPSTLRIKSALDGSMEFCSYL